MCFEMIVDSEDDKLKCNISDAMHCKRQKLKTAADNELTTFSCDHMNITHSLITCTPIILVTCLMVTRKYFSISINVPIPFKHRFSGYGL